MASKWPASDIAYVAVVGLVMAAALFEWLLWLLAFLYCLVKVYQKAENVSTRVLAVIMMFLFTALRAIFLPIMIVTLPLPSQITGYFPQSVVAVLQWFAFWTFSAVLIIPWLLCIYQLVVHSLGRTKKIKNILDEISAPKVVIVMPCYKEVPEILLRTVDSLVDCDYPSSCIHVFLSFDGEQEDDLYLNTIEKLGVPLVRRSGYPISIDVQYHDTRITVSRFPHGGKRHCQKKTFKLVDKIYSEYLKINDNLFVLFIDSDCILDKVCIQNFMYEMELKPGSKQNMLAMTGVITATTEKNKLITLLQDMEYIHGQLFERSVESGCGAVTCLPGALTILRFSAFRKLAKYYFADKAEQCSDLFDYGKCHLGEDRWLTHLFMIASEKRYQIGMSTGAFCKTEAVQTYKSLLKQRRRWFLGFITNEVCMLTDARIWYRYPFLCLVRLAQNTIRTTALLFFIMVVALMTTSQKIEQLPVGFIAVSLGLNWALMIYFSAVLGRYKIILYPVLFVVGPFFNWLYMVYGIFTAGQRTWGGPRADAGQADFTTTPQAAIERAEAMGDDLNIIPETFRLAIDSQAFGNYPRLPQVPLQPSHELEGRFRSVYKHAVAVNPDETASNVALEDGLHRTRTFPHIPLHPRASMDSIYSMSSMGPSIKLPQRMDGFINVDERKVPRRARSHPPSSYPGNKSDWNQSSSNMNDMDPSQQSLYSSYNDSEGSVDLSEVERRQFDLSKTEPHSSIPLVHFKSGGSGPETLRPATEVHDSTRHRRGHSPLARNPFGTDTSLDANSELSPFEQATKLEGFSPSSPVTCATGTVEPVQSAGHASEQVRRPTIRLVETAGDEDKTSISGKSDTSTSGQQSSSKKRNRLQKRRKSPSGGKRN